MSTQILQKAKSINNRENNEKVFIDNDLTFMAPDI